MMEQRFEYNPLGTSVDTIRLLVLHGAPSQESALSCSLFHTDLAECPDYEALSCEWGNPAFTKSLRIEGAELPISENLHEALMHIRIEHDCTLWIDAICTYFDQYRTECRRNLRLEASIFCGVSFHTSLIGR
jgi:Heterokaryon incompatibility protein (HET)